MTRCQPVVSVVIISSFLFGSLFTRCVTQQGYQGGGVGALTGATTGALLDNPSAWRGGLIGGSIGAINFEPSIPVLRP